MNVKIQCECGTRYSFEIEPVHGRMPMPVSCPECGADGTALANTFIQEQLAAESQSSPPAPQAPSHVTPRVRLHKPATQTPTPPETPPTPEATEQEEGPTCPKHRGEAAVETCRVCGKPMCLKCMEMFGYVCSVYCRNKAEREKIKVPVYAHQRSVIERKSRSRTKWILSAATVLIASAVGVWFWYSFFGSHPRVVYSQAIPKDDHSQLYELVAPGQLLSVRNNKATLFDVARQKQLWSTQISSEDNGSSSHSIAATISFDDLSDKPPGLVETEDSFWLAFPDRVLQLNRQTGKQGQLIPLTNHVLDLLEGNSAIIAVSANNLGHKSITRITLPAGAVKSEAVVALTNRIAPTGNTRQQAALTQMRRRGSATSQAMAKWLMSQGSDSMRSREEFYADGDGVTEMNVLLLEHKTVARQAMKAKTKTYVNENLTAANSLDASQEVLNDMRRQRTGGVVEEDVSRYHITLRNPTSKEPPAWTGEVVGPPSFYPLKSVNILCGGTSITVFDKSFKKLWGAKLTYPLPENKDAGSDHQNVEIQTPCVEVGNTLYIFDKGMLTSFDKMTGEVHWRLTSVGISRIQFDEQGKLYVDSTTASPDSIQFSEQIDVFNKTEPVLIKVDPATGKELWRVEKIADNCLLAGNFVYAERSNVDPLASLNPSEPARVHFNLYRLNSSDGHVVWDYYHPGPALQTGVQGNWILLRFKDQVQVLKFLNWKML